MTTFQNVLTIIAWVVLGGLIGLIGAGLLCSSKREEEYEARMRWERERRNLP